MNLEYALIGCRIQAIKLPSKKHIAQINPFEGPLQLSDLNLLFLIDLCFISRNIFLCLYHIKSGYF